MKYSINHLPYGEFDFIARYVHSTLSSLASTSFYLADYQNTSVYQKLGSVGLSANFEIRNGNVTLRRYRPSGSLNPLLYDVDEIWGVNKPVIKYPDKKLIANHHLLAPIEYDIFTRNSSAFEVIERHGQFVLTGKELEKPNFI